MRNFHSYGPVVCERHFCISRKKLVDHCSDQIIRDLKSGGYYFTIWGPRQSGKTWLMKQVRKKIKDQYGGRFVIGLMSMQGIIMDESEPEDFFLKKVPKIMLDGFDMDVRTPESWEEWSLFFHKNKGLFNRPVLVFIDELDNLPPKIIERLATLFRDIYLNQENYLLTGLGLVGVRTALGAESGRGLPFSIQKSLHVPNFTVEEVHELFEQYQQESGEKIKPEVVDRIFCITRGHPGLVNWFGELLTEKYHPGPGKVIDSEIWAYVYRRACNMEWNSIFLNLLKKARAKHQVQVLEIFARSDIPFILDTDWCSYLYLNGLIDSETYMSDSGQEEEVCRFSCPFVQKRLYKVLTYDLVGNFTPVPPLDPFDEISDVFKGHELNISELMTRYKAFLARLKEGGFTPWREQFRRSDLRLREASGHFHLYAWLQSAVGKRCVIRPEFPTGSGKVELHLRCGEKRGIIETRNFVNASDFRYAKDQLAEYAEKNGLDSAVMALFTPVNDDAVLSKLSGETVIRGTRVTVIAIAWT